MWFVCRIDKMLCVLFINSKTIHSCTQRWNAIWVSIFCLFAIFFHAILFGFCVCVCSHLHSKQFPSHSIKVHSRILKYCIELQALGKKMNKGSCCLCTRISNDEERTAHTSKSETRDREWKKKCWSICIAMLHELRYANRKVSECQQHQQTANANPTAHKHKGKGGESWSENVDKKTWLQFLFSRSLNPFNLFVCSNLHSTSFALDYCTPISYSSSTCAYGE